MSNRRLRIVGIILTLPIIFLAVSAAVIYIIVWLNTPPPRPGELIVSHEVHFQLVWPVWLPLFGVGALGISLILASFRKSRSCD